MNPFLATDPRRARAPRGPVRVNWRAPFMKGANGLWLLRPGARNLITGEAVVLSGSASYTASRQGRVGRTVAGTNRLQLAADSTALLPTSGGFSIFLHYRKLGAAAATAGFGVDASADGARRCGTHLPFSDGTLYWDYGGNTVGATRLTAASLVYGDSFWLFTTGARGMEIWQDDILRASNGANPTRNATTNPFMLGMHGTATNSDDAESSIVLTVPRQLSVAEIRLLFKDPYSALEAEDDDIWIYSAGGGALTVTGAGGIASAEAFGSATVARGAVGVTPSGIASAEAFGSPQINQTISGAGNIASAEAFGSTTVVPGVVTITGAGAIASAEAFGSAIVSAGGSFITGAGAIASAEAFGSAAVLPGTVTITGAGGIVSAEAFGAGTLGRYISGAGAIVSAEAFGSAAVQLGTLTIAGAGAIASGEAFGDALIPGGAAYILGAGNIASGEAFGPVPLIPQNYTPTDRILEVEGGARTLDVPGGGRILVVPDGARVLEVEP